MSHAFTPLKYRWTNVATICQKVEKHVKRKKENYTTEI
jgi:hypothetical protein